MKFIPTDEDIYMEWSNRQRIKLQWSEHNGHLYPSFSTVLKNHVVHIRFATDKEHPSRPYHRFYISTSTAREWCHERGRFLLTDKNTGKLRESRSWVLRISIRSTYRPDHHTINTNHVVLHHVFPNKLQQQQITPDSRTCERLKLYETT